MRCPLSIGGRGLFPQSTVSGNVPVAVAARMAPRILPGGPGPGPAVRADRPMAHPLDVLTMI